MSERNKKMDSKYAKCHADILKKGFPPDLTLYVGPERKEMKVHRGFLQVESPYFHRIFQKNPKLNQLDIPDVDPSKFQIILEFVYSCLCPKYIMKKARSLLAIATKFEVEELIEIGFAASRRNFTKENVLKRLEEGMEYRKKELVQAALSFISKNAWVIVETSDFLDLSLDCIVKIARRDDLRVRSEIQLFNAIIKWGEAECKRKGKEAIDVTTSGETNLKKEIKKLIPLIRFPRMDKEEFLKNSVIKEILSPEKALDITCMFVLPIDVGASLQGRSNFNCRPRNYYRPTIFCANRFTEVNSFTAWGYQNEKLNFSMNRDVSLVGIKFQKKTFNIWSNALRKSLNVGEIGWSMFETKIVIGEEGGVQKSLFQLELKPFNPLAMQEILFETVVHLQKNIDYIVEIKFSGTLVHQETAYKEEEYRLSTPTKCCKEGHVNVGDDSRPLQNVRFRFSRSKKDPMHINWGIISGLLFNST